MDVARARLVIADHLGVGIDAVVDEASFRDLGADSLDLVELTMALEHAFDVRIPDDDAFRCASVGDAIDLLARASGGRAAPAPIARVAGAR